jgi:hypothetical protein
MNFSLYDKPRLTKDFILSKLTEEQIFSYYIGGNIFNKKLFRSQLRKDKNPTCSFYRNKSNTLIYKDFATGQSLNCFGYVCELFGCDYFKALQIIANDFNLVKNDSLVKTRGKIISKDYKIEEKEFSKIQVEIQDFTDYDIKWWGKYGITTDILKKYHVFSCKHVFLNDRLVSEYGQHCPIYGYYGNKYQGKELWRIYYPKRKSYRFLTNWPTKKIQGYDQLPKKGKLLVITKSMKDLMVLNSLGISAIAPNSETQIPGEAILDDLKKRFKNIVVLFDNDLTGISFMNKFKKQHPEFIYTWIPRKLNAKDISDYYKCNGKEKTINLIKQFILWLKKVRKT